MGATPMWSMVLWLSCLSSLLTGFARETVEAFKTGFPENWQDVVDKHFRKLQLR